MVKLLPPFYFEPTEKAKYEVELKFTNYDIQDILRGVSNGSITGELVNIFRDKLWKADVYITQILSPLDVPGGRLPLDPKDKEGVFVRIGGTDYFSRDLLDLEREVERLRNRNPCPKKYKATTAEYLFHRHPPFDFQNDWCSFQLIRVSYQR